jgi:hypothetical protein
MHYTDAMRSLRRLNLHQKTDNSTARRLPAHAGRMPLASEQSSSHGALRTFGILDAKFQRLHIGIHNTKMTQIFAQKC